MEKLNDMLLKLIRMEFEKLREEFKVDSCVFDQRIGREESLERCEQIVEKVLSVKDE